MNYLHKDLTFQSTDGKNTIHAELFIPSDKNIKGVVQISHGMVDHIGRYYLLAEALCDAGYVLAGHDHLGHGKSVSDPKDFGFFASNNGYKLVIDDIYVMNSLIRKEFPGVPVVLMGHSMGSFLARLYAIKYADSIDGLIVHGTAGPNPALIPGQMVVKLIKAFKGERHRSPFVRSLAEGGYNKSFDPAEGEGAWLTREGSLVADRPHDPRTNYIFTLSGYADLFNMLGECSAPAWFRQFPSDLPTLIVSGEADPVGDFGKGVKYVYDNLKAAGADVELKLYPGARHELFFETNRDEVFADLIKWIEGVIK